MKKKKRRRAPKYRHYRPKNLAVVRIDGRDHYLGKYDSPESYEKYHRLVAEWLAGQNGLDLAVGDELITESPPLSVTELIYRYKSHVETYYLKDGEPTSEQHCIRSAVRRVRKVYGRTPVVEFTPLKLKAVRERMIQEGICRYSINKYIGPKAQAVLEPFLDRPTDAYCFSPEESARYETQSMEPALTQRDKARRPRKSRRGKRYRRDSYYNAIQRACGRAGIKPWSPNQLRHTRGTVVRRDFGLEASQCVLGHIKADVTEIYAERNFGLARDIMEQTG